MATDGNANWLGGMETSRAPSDLLENQYSKAINVIHPDNLNGLSARFGFRCCSVKFRNNSERRLFSDGHVQGQGYFTSGGLYYLIVVVNGYVFRLKEITHGQYYAQVININSPNSRNLSNAWVIQIPDGCIVNNGFDDPIYVTADSQRRTDPSKGEIGPGLMGVFTHHILFVVDPSGKQILPSDYNQPLKRTEYLLDGLIGFMAPDAEETITAIGKQKTILNYVEGGNLVFSTNRDIYSVDIRGPRSTWRNLNNSVGKVNETIPGFSAASSQSFEAFNTNIYFRSADHGMANLRQSEYQFNAVDVNSNQSIEANYFLANDTDWMLSNCYTRKFNHRLLTTVAPERTEDGYVYWNGILSFNPSQVRSDGSLPNRHESVFTGVRPWGLTSVSQENQRDILFIMSYDHDGVNRLYMADESLDHDVNHRGESVPIQGFIETKAYSFQARQLHKVIKHRIINFNSMPSNVSLKAYSRPATNMEWIQFHSGEFLIARQDSSVNHFNPITTHPQPRNLVLPDEKSGCCSSGSLFEIQYRFEFKGPIRFDWFTIEADTKSPTLTATQPESQPKIIIHSPKKDYDYLISNQ